MIIAIIAVLLLTVAPASAVTDAQAREFLKHLLSDPENLQGHVHPGELALSRRLGIHYEDVGNKFMISYGIDDKNAPILHDITPLDPGFSLLTVRSGSRKYTYYFENDKLVSPVYYHSRDWVRIESDYFVFCLGDPDGINDYSMKRLDEFVERVANTLGISPAGLGELREKKIYYYLCRDGDEIQRLTGYQTRGLYNLAYDYVISTYRCHYHEIAHLLINYRLKSLPLRTHPFFQEGFAVAVGGRGGRAPDVIANTGLFLEESGIAGYTEFISYESFTMTDASITYPVSGFYTRYLMERIGSENYLGLYIKYSGARFRSDVSPGDLPPHEDWGDYLAKFQPVQPIDPQPDGDRDCEVIYADDDAKLCTGAETTLFSVRTAVKLGEAYLITSDDNEISLYDLRTDNLIGKYVPSMSRLQEPVRISNGYRVFAIDNGVFDGNVGEYPVATGDKLLPREQIPQ